MHRLNCFALEKKSIIVYDLLSTISAQKQGIPPYGFLFSPPPPHLQEVDVVLMEEVPIKGKLTTSSNAAMSNSLTDGSTETFWESRDEPRGKPRQLTITFDKEKEVFGVSVHIDNQKDGGVSKLITQLLTCTCIL